MSAGKIAALVTDVHFRNGVAAVRALGRAGVEVGALAPFPAAAGRWSRYTSHRAIGPDAAVDPSGFAEAVARAAREQGPSVVFPCREESIDALLDARRDLPEEAILPYPSGEAPRTIRDKRELPRLADAVGMRTPVTFFAGPAADVEVGSVSLPALVKPLSKHPGLPHPVAVHSGDELGTLLGEVPPDLVVIVQERVEGRLMALSLVLGRDGALLAAFQQVARRTWPPSAGPSTLAVSVPLDQELARRASDLLGGEGYWGLAQLQFVDDGSRPALIDVNLRFYGSLALALASGVALPLIWYEVALDRRPREVTAYRTGVTYRWLENELVAAVHGRPSLISERAPRPKTGAMWARDDPIPAGLLAGRALGGWLARRLRALT